MHAEKVIPIEVIPKPGHDSRAAIRAAVLSSPREMENRVRDVFGLSRREAKRLVAGGWSALTRDESDMDQRKFVEATDRLESLIERLGATHNDTSR